LRRGLLERLWTLGSRGSGFATFGALGSTCSPRRRRTGPYCDPALCIAPCITSLRSSLLSLSAWPAVAGPRLGATEYCVAAFSVVPCTISWRRLRSAARADFFAASSWAAACFAAASLALASFSASSALIVDWAATTVENSAAIEIASRRFMVDPPVRLGGDAGLRSSP
jgi:hypothetical protein